MPRTTANPPGPAEEAGTGQETVEQLLLEKYEPIAVVGMGLRFPGDCDTPGEFEEFLREGRSGIRPLPEDRWDASRFVPGEPGEKGKIQTTGGGFLDRIDLFDAPFFNISPKEAQYIDPQQRMLLETSWHALEDANIDPTALRRGNGGVYIGASSIDYALELDTLPYEELDGHLASGITLFPLAGRLSYFLGWRGPSVSVDTACSSSLCALHMAVQGLRRGECDIALAGGVNALHSPRIMVMFSHGQMLAPDGQCKTFDDSADGYVRAEGCGVVVLKRLSDAERDGDTVLALVRGTAIGQDGDSAGLTVPHGPAQELTIRNALAASRLEPSDIQYVEAHGTGTPLGDPIELGAINDVFADSHTKERPLLVGSAKTNLGHMEPASGIVGVIKSVLQLRSGTIFPHLNFNVPSTRIPWDTFPITVPTHNTSWPEGTRRAVVNSFGFAGTISAAVLEQAPEREAVVPETDEQLPELNVFTLSGKSEQALRAQTESFQRYLEEHPDADISRLCYTTNVGRSHFAHRLAGPVADRKALLRLLDAGPVRDKPAGSRVRKVSFLFSGQGSQYAGMGADLYRAFPVFREHVDVCDRLFAAHLPVSVKSLLLGTEQQTADTPGGALIDRTQYTQPALFTLEYALAQLWMSWGVRPNVLIGHSIGEVTAAAVAGLFSVEDAVTLVAVRGRLMQSVTQPGGMIAVNSPAENVVPLLADYPGLALAAVNAPAQCVISGASEPLEKLAARLREDGRRADVLAVSHAFHSPLMTEVFDEFRDAVAGITFRRPTIALVSNTSGRVARYEEIATPDYWVRHIGEPVRFLDGIRAVGKRGRHVMVEVGPSGALTALARQCLDVDDHVWITSLRRRDAGKGVNTLLHGLAELYTTGLAVHWPGVHLRRELPKLVLPGYAFQRRRYWLPSAGPSDTGGSGPAVHPLLGRAAASQESTDGPDSRERVPAVSEFVTELTPGSPAWPAGHPGPDGAPALPAASYVELLLALADALDGHTRGELRDIVLSTPSAVSADTGTVLRTRAVEGADGAVSVEITGRDGGEREEERLLCTAVLDRQAPGREREFGDAAADLTALAAGEPAAGDRADAFDVYTDLASVDRDMGARMRNVSWTARHAGDVVTAELTCRPATAVEQVPPEVLESALHAVAALEPGGPSLTATRIGRVRLFKKPRGSALRVVARVRPADGGGRHADLLLLDAGAPVIELTGVELMPPAAGRGSAFLHRHSWLRQSLPAEQDGPERVLLAVSDGGRLTGPAAERLAAGGVRVVPVAGADELAAALAEPEATDVCWFWTSSDEPMTAALLRAESERNYRELLSVIKALATGESAGPRRLWVVSEASQWLPGDKPGTGGRIAAASLSGFVHALLNEQPQHRATLVDLDADTDVAVLAAELRAPDTGEYQIAFRAGRRHVRRILDGSATPPSGGFLVPAGSGEAVPADDVPPGAGEVRVRIETVRLTSSEPGPVRGADAVGTVEAVGPGAAWQAGRTVRVPGPGTLRSTVTVPSSEVTPAAPGETLAPAGDTYGLDELDEALRHIDGQRAVAVRLPATGPGPSPEPANPVRPDRAYLISGGLGGLGLVTAQKLADLGARHLFLLSRSGRPAAGAAEDALAALSGQAEVTVLRADVSSADDMAEVMRRLREAPVPVGGIVHAAGTDGTSLISDLTWEDIDAQLSAQAYGGWLLHEASLDLPDLDFFVVHSSLSAVIGGATQAHYAAAFAFLDTLMARRRGLGLPGLSVNWGAWGKVGMSARLDENLGRELRRSGIRLFSPARALRELTALLSTPTAEQWIGGELDWSALAPGLLDNALYSRVVRHDEEDTASRYDLAALLAKPGPERLAEISALVLAGVASVLHAEDPEQLDLTTPFLGLGLDSLMAMELRSGLEAALRVPLPATLTFDHPSPQHVAEFLDARLVAAQSA
ncbi:SDR family NAD(P)-dependent oxidoreductase [Streptomyces sp. NPDC088725]|uniref:SDR family NAD(P)-dependent oxidoreductase n=1 Tax=Streptomyces sp. NPDC088725 TaxID=3365873 RepID=UPI003829F4F6